MDRKNKKRIVNLLLALFMLLLFVTGSLVILGQEAVRQEEMIEKDVAARANALREYLLGPKHLLHVLQGSMREHLYLAESEALSYSLVENIENIPERSIFALLPPDAPQNVNRVEPSLKFIGSLTGDGSVSQLTKKDFAELNATLELNALFDSVLTSLPDIKWVYYTSVRRFLYLAPAATLEQYYFQEDDLLKAFWQEGIPENNPTHQLIVTQPYLDGAGKGMLVSISLPVFYAGEFRGMLSVDIGLDSLVRELESVSICGGSALLSENHQVIIKQDSLATTEIQSARGDLLYLEDILGKQIRLLHKVPYFDVMLLALRVSVLRLLLLASLMILGYMFYRQWQMAEDVRDLADTDPLTRLMNRRAMLRVVQSMIDCNCRYQQSISFMLIDIDKFKQVNDTHGHSVGDEVLVAVSRELKLSVRAADQISRHGGEEFLIASPNSNLDEIYQLAERVRKNIEQKSFSSRQIPLTVSIGCAELRKDETYSDVLCRADKALYRAKSLGRNCTEKAG